MTGLFKEEVRMRVVPAIQQEGKVTVYIEVRDGPEIFAERQRTRTEGGSVAPRTVECIDAAGAAIADVCARIYFRLGETLKGSEIPDELSVEFGVTLGGNAGLPIVTEGPSQGTFKVMAKWRKQQNTETTAVPIGTNG
jgi:hypothetical protein